MPAGRPKKEIDKKTFENLCGLQCTEAEICGFFNVTDKTLSSWCKREYGLKFSEVFAQKRGLGKISLRRAQFQLAEKSAAMAIFLGKQYLGQSDTPTTDMHETVQDDALTASLKELAERMDNKCND